jgi:hypothetical protein
MVRTPKHVVCGKSGIEETYWQDGRILATLVVERCMSPL